MDKGKARVGVLMGGLSSERDISMKSGRAVAEALDRRGWNLVPIEVGRDLPRRLIDEGVNVAWIALHGRFGEDGCVQGLLEVMGIPYTGSDVRASAVAMDKIATKRALAGVEEVVLARDEVFRKGEPYRDQMHLPLVVKPAVGGSTIGIHVVRTPDELQHAVGHALKYDDRVLVEQYVEGEEITVAVLDGSALPVVRIVPNAGFFDYEAKYTEGRTRYEVPANIPQDVARRASVAAVAAYEALGCRGLARADFMVGADGVPVFLEINTIPGMAPTSLSPMAAKADGIGFDELVERILLGAASMSVENAWLGKPAPV